MSLYNDCSFTNICRHWYSFFQNMHPHRYVNSLAMVLSNCCHTFFSSVNIWFCQTMNYMKICAQLMCWNIYYVFYIIWEYSHIHYHHWIFIFWVAFLQWHLFCTGITVCCKFFKCSGNSMTIYRDHCEHSNLHNIHVV